MLETVRSIRLTLDAEMQRMTGGLQVLALTDTLRNGDFEGFRRIALGFLEQYGKGGVLLVADRDGRMLFSSVTTDTANLPLRNNRDIVEQGLPHPTAAIFQPVRRRREEDTDRDRRGAGVSRRRGDLRHLLRPPIEMFQPILEKQRPSDATGRCRCSTRDGVVFARVPNPEETFGKRASPSILTDMLHGTEATLPTVSLEGVPLMSRLRPFAR